MAAESPKTQPIYITGIGASAGGLEALEQLFSHMPANTGIAFVVIQHLSPDYKSLMVELLSKHTDMNVVRAEDGTKVQPNHIYLIPPKKNMTIYNGCLQLREKHPETLINLPIDIFFGSLSKDQGERAVGIILSGTGSDGTRGVRAIKEAGGMIMVQEESSAKFNGMPRSALATGVADFVLPPHEIPAEMITYVQHRRNRAQDHTYTDLMTDDDKLGKIFQLVKNQTGVDFTHYKPSTASRRIERRLHVHRLESLTEYLQYLLQTPREVNQLYKEMLIGVTNFFRDYKAFQTLQDVIIPRIIEGRSNNAPIRIWSSGCATGEEAYSLAILFSEAMRRSGKSIEVKIFATDIDRDSLEFAAAGAFPESIAADLSSERLQQYFTRVGGKYQIARHIREMVVFAPHNVIKDPPFTRIDLICCRNLLIYLQPVLQKKVLALFRFALKPKGYLMLGSSESVLDYADQFRSIDSKWKIYQLREGAKTGLAETLNHPDLRANTLKQLPRMQRIQKRNNKNELLETICRTLVDLDTRSCIVVNERFEVTYVFGGAEAYVSFSSGEASLDIIKLAPKPLSLALSATLQRCKKEGKPIIYSGIVFQHEQHAQKVNLNVSKTVIGSEQLNYYLIFIESAEKDRSDSDIETTVNLQEQTSQHISDLEHDLQFTRENLQATIEELETSNEELQATNEELLSSNEELQSTNEELQSVNEELYTVNTEYQNKIQEMTALNNDMENLIRCTDIGTIFLDTGLIIRKYTPAAIPFVGMIEKDIGRPFFDLSHRIRYSDFEQDMRYVLESQETITKKVKHVDGDPVLVKIFPYLDEFSGIQGLVINFVDVTPIKKIEWDLMKMQKEKDIILDTVSEAILYFNTSLAVTWANQAAFEILSLAPEILIGRRVEQIWPNPNGTPDSGPVIRAFKSGETCEHSVDDPSGKKWILKDVPITGNGGGIKAVVEFARLADSAGHG